MNVLEIIKNCHLPSLKSLMRSFGQLHVHGQPLCGDIIGSELGRCHDKVSLL